MRILISAYACEPDTGSEPGVGWNWSLQAASHGHEVHVITRSNNRGVIDSKLEQMPTTDAHFHYVDLPSPFLRAKRFGGTFGLLGYYYLWQLRAARLARRLHGKHSFDVVHHVTLVNDWMPSGLASLPAAFIWGPVGGSTHLIPKQIRKTMPASTRRYEFSRWLLQRFLRRLDPLTAQTRRRASLILTYTEEALDGIPPRHRHKSRSIVHIGVSEDDLPGQSRFPAVESSLDLLVVTGGRLVHWKGFDLLIEGFARFAQTSEGAPRLRVTGDGPFRSFLEDLSETLGIREQVEFLGQLPSRDDVLTLLLDSHLYALPTIRDGPPVAILEAMLAARPVLCLDFGATKELVPEDAGLKIACRSRDQIVSDIADGLTWAQANTDELRKMGLAAQRHALTVHNWDVIGNEIESIYRETARSEH